MNKLRDGVLAELGWSPWTGAVPVFAQKWAAEEATERARGVRGVVDALKVDFQTIAPENIPNGPT